MAAYTFNSEAVFDADSDTVVENAAGGKLVAEYDGAALPIFDLNDNPITEITSGPSGQSIMFKANVYEGLIQFGSVAVGVTAREVATFAVNAQGAIATAEAAQDAVEALEPRVEALEAGGVGGAADWSTITNKPDTFPSTAHTHGAGDISDSTATGRNLMRAADATTARALIGAGTGNGNSNVQIGTGPTDAAAGNHTHTASTIAFTPAGGIDSTTVQAAILEVLSEAGGGGGGSGTALGWVSVASYGAVGNGSTDDTSAIQAAITAAGARGTVYFPRTSAYYRVSASLKPLERQMWVGQHHPRYAWDDNVTGGSIIRAAASFAGTAVIHNTTGTTNGAGGNVPSAGVILRNLGIFGNGATGEDGAVDGIDFGPASGSERSWMIERCQIMYTSTALAGYQWVVTVKDCHISRNGWGLSPQRGADTTSRINDSLYQGNYFYFNKHDAVDIGGSVESGLLILANNRFERSGVSMNPMDPNSNRDTLACGVKITRATCVVIMGNTSDANAGPGLNLDAAAHGSVNNIRSIGNIWKRDGTGDNSATTVAGVKIKDTLLCSIDDTITYGDPNDGGAGRSAPQYGLEYEANDWLNARMSIQLDNNTNTRNNGFRCVGTANYMCSVSDNRQPALSFPAIGTANAPVNPQAGTAYFDTTLDAIRVWDGAAWAVSSGGGGGGSTGTWKGTPTEYAALGTYDDTTTYYVFDGAIRRTYVGADLVNSYTVTFSGFRNSFVGISSGTTVTTGNSGATSGDAFTSVTGAMVVNTSADLTAAYDRGVICSLAASSNAYVAYTHSTYSAGGYVRTYMRRASAPGVTTRVARGYDGVTLLWEIRWQADGQVILANGNGDWIKSVAGVTGTNTIYRVEAYIYGSDADLRVFTGESITPMTVTDQAFAPTAGAWTETRFGIFTTSAQTLTHELAAVAVGTSGWIGPA